MNAPVSRAEFVHILYGSMPADSYTARNSVSDNAIPDVFFNDAAATEMGVIDDAEAQAEHDRILAPWERKGTNRLKYNDFEDPIRQIMDYYAKYRRNMAGMRLALEKLALVESYTDRVVATNTHELMRLHEAFDLLELCRAHLEACLQRKESGRGMYQLSDYPEKDPELAKGLVLTRKDGAFQFGWTE